METFNHIVRCDKGRYTRAVAVLSRKSSDFASDITLKNAGFKANARQLFELMCINANQGDNISVTVSGTDERFATKEVKKFLMNNL